MTSTISTHVIPVPSLDAEVLGPSLLARVKQPGEAGAHFWQRLAFVLVLDAFKQFVNEAAHWFGLIAGFGAGIASGWVYMYLFAISQAHHPIMGMIYFGFTALAMLGMAYGFASGRDTSMIEFKRDKREQITGLKLGRLNDILSFSQAQMFSTLLGFVFMCQVAIVRYFGFSYLGIAHTTLLSSLSLSFDNLVHGVLLGIPHLFGWGSPQMDKLNKRGAIAFSVFRAIYDGLIGAVVYMVISRRKISQVYRTFPADPTREAVLAWMENICGDQAQWTQWGRRLHDEIIFNLICCEYFRGNFTGVAFLADRFRNINVAKDVREMFRDNSGVVLFKAIPEAERRPKTPGVGENS